MLRAPLFRVVKLQKWCRLHAALIPALVLPWKWLNLHHSPSSLILKIVLYYQWRTEGGFEVFKPPPPKFRNPSKIVPNSTQ